MIFDKVKEIIIEQLQVDESEVTLDTNLMKDLSADSLDAVEIIMAIEDEYGIEVPDEEDLTEDEFEEDFDDLEPDFEDLMEGDED